MSKRVLPLLDDPTTHSSVRDLLQAGRDANVSDYDYGAALQRHIGMVQAGAPMPDWAKGLEAGAGKGAAAAAAAAGSSLVGWWALPVAGVAVAAAIGAAVLFRSEESIPHARPHGVGAAPVAAPVVPAASGVVPAAPVTAQAEPSEQAAQPSQGEARAAIKVRSGSAQKAPPAKHAQGAANGHAAASNSATSNGGKADLFATAPSATGTRSAQTKSTTTSGSTVAAAQQPAAAAEQAQPEQNAVAADDEPAAQQPAPVDDTRLEREMGMLAVAQRVLQVDPARTLSLARQGEAEFAGSMFTPERKQLELLALVKLGRLDEAKRLARPYLARYPNGPFSDRVRRALSTGHVDR